MIGDKKEVKYNLTKIQFNYQTLLAASSETQSTACIISLNYLRDTL